jgi:N-methylhydantoinase B/oxoprolinase/acetone carboxylase alpha subunit
MTNTRITDPEVKSLFFLPLRRTHLAHVSPSFPSILQIFERRYPVLLHQFAIRENSGGAGAFRGGDGVVRDIEFLQPIQASILSEVCTAPLFLRYIE